MPPLQPIPFAAAPPPLPRLAYLPLLPLVPARAPQAGADRWQPGGASLPPRGKIERPDLHAIGPSAPAALALGGARAATFAGDVLRRYAAWARSPEGQQYVAWRTAQLQLPEAQRTTGAWGQAAGLNGYLRGNEPQHVWAKSAAGLVWRYRCNILVYDAAYAGGFAVPRFTHPDTLAKRFLREERGLPPVGDRLHDYFERVDLAQARAGDWMLMGNNGKWGHVVLVTGPPGPKGVPIAQAGSNPQPQATLARFQDGRLQGHYHEALILRPRALRAGA